MDSKQNPYAHRSHRQKCKQGYGIEGQNSCGMLMPVDATDNPKPVEKDPKSANQKPQQSKKRPNPY